MKAFQKTLYPTLFLLGVALVLGGSYAYGDELASTANFVMVSHSEYWSGEQGQIIGKLYNYRGQPILATCNVTIYNPDKSIFLAPTPTDDTLETLDGTHYINFTTPTTEGVYEYMIECGYTINNQFTSRKISNSFHLNPALNAIKVLNQTLAQQNATLQNLFTYVNTINQTTWNDYLLDLQQNQTLNSISGSLSGINQSAYNAYLASIQANATAYQTYLAVIAQNNSLNSILANVTHITSVVDQIRADQFTDVDAYNNFTAVNNNFAVVNTKLDNLATNVSYLMQYCSNPQTNSSVLCQLVWDTNTKVTASQNTLNYISNVQLQIINQTTQNTYDFLVVNVTQNFNNVFSSLNNIQSGINQINATANRIEANLASNTSTIISNQEGIVYFDVMS